MLTSGCGAAMTRVERIAMAVVRVLMNCILMTGGV